MKAPRINTFIWLFLLAFTVSGAACSLGNAQKPVTTETIKSKSTESPTPAYQPPKRVSRDIIKTDSKDDATKVKKK